MAPVDPWLVAPFFLLGAMLYTSVGHGGATVYLAILTLANYAVRDVTTTVLALNIMAATIAFVMFQQAGHLIPRLLLPFVLASVPFAYLGGRYPFSDRAQLILLGVVLLLAGLRLLLLPRPPRIGHLEPCGWALYVGAPILGALLGFVAGATGIGGGIFLSPILLILGWTDVRQAGTIASAFIVLNSLAGLTAKVQTTPVQTTLILVFGLSVFVGAMVGSFLGARRLPPRALQILLGAVLIVAGLKSLL